jgi:hypothetical protein
MNCHPSLSLAGAMLTVTVLAGPTPGQELADPLQMLAPLLGKTWVGHYVDSPADQHLTHIVRWEAALDGQAVRQTKEVPELGFSLESFYYWDWERKEVVFLTLTSRGFNSHGVAHSERGSIIMLGLNLGSDSAREFKLRFDLLPGDRLRDRFFLKQDDGWEQRHLIEYAAQISADGE